MFKRAVPLGRDQAAHKKEPSWLKNIMVGEKKGI
jgi:hypothetical protein